MQHFGTAKYFLLFFLTVFLMSAIHLTISTLRTGRKCTINGRTTKRTFSPSFFWHLPPVLMHMATSSLPYTSLPRFSNTKRSFTFTHYPYSKLPGLEKNITIAHPRLIGLIVQRSCKCAIHNTHSRQQLLWSWWRQRKSARSLAARTYERCHERYRGPLHRRWWPTRLQQRCQCAHGSQKW